MSWDEPTTRDELVGLIAEIISDHVDPHVVTEFPETYFVCTGCSKSVETNAFPIDLDIELWWEEHVAEEIVYKLERRMSLDISD